MNFNINDLEGLNPEFITEEQIKLKPNQQAIIYDVESGEVNLPDVQEILSKVIEILEYMTTDEILELRSKNKDEYEEHMEEKFVPFSDRYYGLFKQLISGKDITPLIEMLTEIEKIKEGNTTIEEAEHRIGRSLEKKFVTPNLNKK